MLSLSFWLQTPCQQVDHASCRGVSKTCKETSISRCLHGWLQRLKSGCSKKALAGEWVDLVSWFAMILKRQRCVSVPISDPKKVWYPKYNGKMPHKKILDASCSNSKYSINLCPDQGTMRVSVTWFAGWPRCDRLATDWPVDRTTAIQVPSYITPPRSVLCDTYIYIYII